MKNSAERISFITDYLLDYKNKIEVLNKNGLHDAAVTYELFAAELCQIWFTKGFRNLNIERPNFPSIDLISEDGSICVQVSTGKNIQEKIVETLKRIRDAQDDFFRTISDLYFFVLGNDNVKKIPDYSGEKKIGNIDFVADKNIISIDKIIGRARTDFIFQKALYDLIVKETQTLNHSASDQNLKEVLDLLREEKQRREFEQNQKLRYYEAFQKEKIKGFITHSVELLYLLILKEPVTYMGDEDIALKVKSTIETKLQEHDKKLYDTYYWSVPVHFLPAIIKFPPVYSDMAPVEFYQKVFLQRYTSEFEEIMKYRDSLPDYVLNGLVRFDNAIREDLFFKNSQTIKPILRNAIISKENIFIWLSHLCRECIALINVYERML